MAALNFPNSPSLNDTHTENGVTFKWNGAAWDRLGDIGAQGSTGAAGAQGATGSTGAQGATGPVAGSSTQVVYKDGSNNPAGSANFTFDGTNLTVGGNVSIGGTLTYEDVTNIDSVGIITARDKIKLTICLPMPIPLNSCNTANRSNFMPKLVSLHLPVATGKSS